MGRIWPQYFTKTFPNRHYIDRLINLRFAGHSINALAIIFKCDHTCIINKLDRYAVSPAQAEFPLLQVINPALVHEFYKPPKPQEWRMIDRERVRVGKAYKDYFD